MRQQKYEITDTTKLERFLDTNRVGRLGTIDSAGFPYITPVNYVYWQNTVYFHSGLKGERIDNIARNSKVGFEIDVPLAYLDTEYDKNKPACSVGQFYLSVIIRGRAEVVDAAEEKLGALNALMDSHEYRPDCPEITSDMPAVGACTVIAVRIESMSGKANLAQAKSPDEKERICQYLIDRNKKDDLATVEFIRDFS